MADSTTTKLASLISEEEAVAHNKLMAENAARYLRRRDQDALIEECLKPLQRNEGMNVLQMRTIRLLAAILERLP
jgi:hypothetical protein